MIDLNPIINESERILIEQQQITGAAKELCSIIDNKPITFIFIALFLDILESFLIRKWKENKIIFEFMFYKLDTNELLIIMKTAKNLCLVVALVFLYMRLGTYGL